MLVGAASHQPQTAWEPQDPRSSALEQLLCGVGSHALVEAARFHKLGHQLLVHGGPLLRQVPFVHDGLQTMRAQAVIAELLVVADLGLLAPVLDANSPGWLVLKGAALGASVYGSPVERPAGDLDVLVHPHDFPRVVVALEGIGAQVVDRNWKLLVEEARGQLHLVLPHGSLLDLHWHVLNREVVRHDFDIRTEDLLAAGVPLTIGATAVRTLDPVHTVLHLGLHGAMSGGHRVGWLMDVDRALRLLRPDPARLLAEATSWRARAAIGCILWRANRFLATPMDPSLVQQLAPRSTRAMALALQRLDPVGGRADDSGPTSWWTPTLRDRGSQHLSPRIRRQLGVGRALARVRQADSPAPSAFETSPGVGREDYFDLVMERPRQPTSH